jgi:hypothetical protein
MGGPLIGLVKHGMCVIQTVSKRLTIFSLEYFSIPKMVPSHSSETSVLTTFTLCHVPEDGILHNHCRKSLKSYI